MMQIWWHKEIWVAVAMYTLTFIIMLCCILFLDVTKPTDVFFPKLELILLAFGLCLFVFALTILFLMRLQKSNDITKKG